MNKIYKLVWSKTKNMYVAVCEFAKSHTKSPQTSGISKVVTAGVLASVLSYGVVMPASAAQIPITNNDDIDGNGHYVYFIGDASHLDTNVGNVFAVGEGIIINNGSETTVGEGIIAIGDNVNISLENKVANSRSSSSADSPNIKHVVALGDSTVIGEENTVAIGYQAEAKALNAFAGGTKALALSEGATVLGQGAVVNEDSSFAIAVGYESEATGEGANAFGDNAKAADKFAVAFGRATEAQLEASTAIGNEAIASAKRAVAIGNETTAQGENSVAIGNATNAKSNASVAIGNQAIANGGGNNYAVAIGNNAKIGSATTGYGETLAVGGNANVQATYGTALGSSTSVTTQNGTAIGYNAQVTASNATAIGAGSIANSANTVSVGTTSATRKIVNVTAGTANTDASTISQTGNQLALSGNTLSLKTATGTVLNSVTLDSGNTYSAGNGLQLTGTEFSAKAGTNVTVNANGINVAGNGVIDNGDTGLISGGTLYNEVNVASNGNYIVTGNTTAQNLGALDDAIKDADDSAIKFITANGTTVTYTKGDGTTGTFTTQDNNTEYTAGNGLQLNGTEFSAKAGTNVTVDGDGISVIGNGTVVSGNTGLVSGDTIFDETRVASNGNYIQATNTASQNLVALDNALKDNADALDGKANVALDNITDAGKTVIKTNAKEAINVVGSGKATVNKTDVSGVDTYTVGVTVDGSVTNGDTGIVDDGTVYNALIAESCTVQDGNYITTANSSGANLTALDTAIKNATDGLDGKANTSLDNITDAGKTVVRDLAKESVKVINGTNTTVTEGTDGTYKTYAVNVSSDGAVASGNTGIVTGGTVYDALQTQKGEIEDALDGKANVALNNISDAGHSVIKTDAKSAINVVGGDYATVDKIDVNGVDTYTVNVATDGAVAENNVKLVTGDTVFKYVRSRLVPISEALDNKANISLSNLSPNGRVLINGIAKGSLDFYSGNINDLTITRDEFDETLDTVTFTLTKNGEVEENNEGLVTGGKIYSKINETVASALADYDDGVQLSLDSKANVTLNNIDNAGHNVIKSDAKQAINVVGGTYATVAKTDADGVDTYTVNVATDGQVVSGNNKLVTGDTVYNAIQGTVEDIGDALDGKANVGLNNITADGEIVVRDLAKTAVKVVNGSDTTVTEGTDGTYKTYAVNVTKNGVIADGNTGIVTGGTVYTALEDKANVSLDNIDTAGEGVIQDIAKQSVLVGDGDNTTVASETDANGNITYKVTANATGTITDGDTGLVDGGTVYNSLNTLEQNINNALDDKADIDLDNITAGGNTVIQNIAKQSVIVGDGENTTVTSETDANGNITYRVKADATGSVQSGNTGLVDGGTVYDAIYTKANTSLNNIDNDGEEVIKDLAKQSINVTNGNSIAVVKTEVNGVDTYEVSVNANGVIADGNTGAVSGDTVYDYYMNDSRPAFDGNYIIKNGTVGANLTALDGQVKGNTNNITNLKDLSNITDAGRTVIKNNAKEAVNVTGGTNATIEKTDVSGVDTYTVNVVSDGAVARGDTKLVTGGTVHVALTNAINQVIYDTEFGLESKANRDMDNLTDAGKEVVNEIAKSALEFQSGNLNDVTIDREAVTDDLDRVTINLTKNGIVEENNEGVVTGGAVYSKMNEAIADAITDYNAGVQVVVDSKANISLDNINDEGRTVIRNVAKDAVKLENGTNTTVSSTTDANGNITYKVNAVATGAVEDGNADIVSGGVVYDAIQDAISSSGTIEGKANIALDNISNAGKNVIKTQAKSAINVVGENDVTVAKTDDGGVDKYTVSVAKNGTIANGDNGIVTGGTVKTALDALETNVQSDLDGKANVALDNIDADGVNAVRNIAKTAVTVADGENTTVIFETDGDGNISYKVKTNATGVIADGDTGLVDGGTVYTAIANSEAGTATALEGKANVSLDNIVDSGKEVIKTNAKEAITVVGSDDVVITKTSPNDVDTYTVSVNKNGAVVDGDTNLVTGDTVFDAIEGKANTDLDNISTDGVMVVRNIAKNAVSLADGDNTTVSSETDADGNITYKVTANTNGIVADGDVNIVSGGTVYSAIQSAVSASETGTDAKLDGKANVSLDNITDDGKTVIQNATNIVSGDGIISVTPTTENGVKTYTVSANISVDGTVADGNTGLVSGGTMYTELRPADGNYVRQADTTAQNLTALDTALNDVSDRVDTVETDVANLKDLSNITDNGRSVIREVAKGSVKVINGTHTTVAEGTDDDAKTYAVNVAVDGAIETGNTGLVSGGAVYDYVQSAIGSSASNVAIADGDNTTVTSSTEGNVTTYRIKANATGTIADDDTGLVDGNTVYDALQDTMTTVNSSINTAKTDVLNSVANDLTGKANIALDNIDDNGKVVVKDLALQSVQFANGDHTQVVNETVDHVRTTKVSVLTDGTVTEGNTGVVSGGTVYNAIDNAKIEANSYTDTAFADAAHKSLNNLNDDGQMVLRDSAINAVKIVNGQHTTVGYEDKTAGREYHVDVNSDGLVEYNNNGLVTGGTVFDALAIYNSNILALMDGFLDTKANINLDNLNDSGKSRVRSLAQSAVKVVPGQNTSVTVSADGTYLTYAVDVYGDGAVASDNNGLLKGSTVYNEVHTGDGNYIASSNSASQNLTALDTSLKELSDKVDNIPSGGSDANAVHYDGTDKDIVTMAGADGTTITNVKAGVNDTDAVNVSQLSALATKSELSDAKSELEGRISVTEDLLAGDWGGQTVKEKIDDNTSAINNVSDRVTTVEGTVGEHTNAINNLQGDISILTTDVNTLGGRVDDVELAVVGKANIDLDNISDNGVARVADIAKGSVNIVSGDNNIVVEKTDVDGKDTYNVSVNTNGIVAEGDTGIVTGGTVYDAIQNIETKQPHYYSVNETHRDETTYNNGGAIGEDALAIGIGSKAEGDASVALGRSNLVTGYNSTAVGIGQTVAGNRSGAFGDPNTVNGDGSYVMGNDNTIDGNDTFVMGSDVTATGDNSVVLGKGSDGSQSNVVSVGATDAERRIVHVNDGVDDTDAVNVRQLKSAKSELEGRVKVTEDLLAGDWGGQTVKDKIDKNAGDINDLRNDLGNKANVDASNIDVDKFTDKLGIGDVVEGNNGLVKGGVVYDAIQKIRDTNIVPSADGTTLNVGPGSDAVMVDFTNSNGDGRVLTGIVTDPDNPNSAANVGYVDAVGQSIINGVNNGLKNMDNKINKVGAGAAAMASLAPLPFDEDQKWSVSAAVGTYHGEQAGALGVFYKPSDNVMLNMRGTFGNGENMAGAGVTIGLEKKSSMGVSKVAMAKAMNAQAKEISAQKEQIAEQQRMLEMQQAQIEQLKRVVEQVVAKK